MVILLVNENRSGLKNRIRRLLESRSAMQLAELETRLEEDREVIRSELEVMREAGVIERLRPVACQRDDHDFFRLSQPASPWRELRASFTSRDFRTHIRLAGEAVACRFE